MDLMADEYEPLVLLNDGENYTGLGGCKHVVLTQEEAERIADGESNLSFLMDTEAQHRVFDLEDVVRWAFANGYQDPKKEPHTR